MLLLMAAAAVVKLNQQQQQPQHVGVMSFQSARLNDPAASNKRSIIVRAPPLVPVGTGALTAQLLLLLLLLPTTAMRTPRLRTAR